MNQGESKKSGKKVKPKQLPPLNLNAKWELPQMQPLQESSNNTVAERNPAKSNDNELSFGRKSGKKVKPKQLPSLNLDAKWELPKMQPLQESSNNTVAKRSPAKSNDNELSFGRKSGKKVKPKQLPSLNLDAKWELPKMQPLQESSNNTVAKRSPAKPNMNELSFGLRKASIGSPATLESNNLNIIGNAAMNPSVNAEVQQGVLVMRIIGNSKNPSEPNSPQTMSFFPVIEDIFMDELPMLSAGFVKRQLYDFRCKTMLLVKRNQPIGGICYMTYSCQDIVELVFCAIKSSEQHEGYGKYLVFVLKDYLMRRGYKHLLVNVVGDAKVFFEKQGFSDRVTLPRSRYRQRLVPHKNATLMHLKLNPNAMMVTGYKLAKKPVHQPEPEPQPLRPNEIQYVSLDGTVITLNTDIKPMLPGEYEDPFDLTPILKLVRKHEDAWPFRNMLASGRVPVNYFHLKEPMDLKTIDQRLRAGQYKTPLPFINDMNLIFENCREHNGRETDVYQCGQNLERYYYSIMPYLSKEKNTKKKKKGRATKRSLGSDSPN